MILTPSFLKERYNIVKSNIENLDDNKKEIFLRFYPLYPIHIRQYYMSNWDNYKKLIEKPKDIPKLTMWSPESGVPLEDYLNPPKEKGPSIRETHIVKAPKGLQDVLSRTEVSTINDLKNLYVTLSSFVRLSDKVITLNELESIISVFEDYCNAVSFLYKNIYEKESRGLSEAFFRRVFSIISTIRLFRYINFTDIASAIIDEYNKIVAFHDQFELDVDKRSNLFSMYAMKTFESSTINLSYLFTLYEVALKKAEKGEKYIEYSEEVIPSNIEDITDDTAGKSEADIQIFGDKELTEEYLSSSKIQNIKEDILKLTDDVILSYLRASSLGNENTKINYNIPEQYKMYIKSELECNMASINIILNSEIRMLTIIRYDGDLYLLFTIEGDDTLKGITLHEIDSEYHDRKIFEVDKDEDLSFELILDADSKSI